MVCKSGGSPRCCQSFCGVQHITANNKNNTVVVDDINLVLSFLALTGNGCSRPTGRDRVGPWVPTSQSATQPDSAECFEIKLIPRIEPFGLSGFKILEHRFNAQRTPSAMSGLWMAAAPFNYPAEEELLSLFG